MLLENVNEV